jgi:hypothetical protein
VIKLDQGRWLDTTELHAAGIAPAIGRNHVEAPSANGCMRNQSRMPSRGCVNAPLEVDNPESTRFVPGVEVL